MTHYHIIIQQERRTQPERMAFVMGSSIPTGNTVQGPMGETQEYIAGPLQLHIMATREEIYAGRIKTATANGDELEVLRLQEQMASGATPDFSDPQYVMVAEWDGNPNYVIQHKGDYSTKLRMYGGWPEITREEYDAIPAPPAK